MRLLVVEDEQSLQEDITRKLRLSGYEVDSCGDGETALDMLAAERYDLVLLDLNLPRVDGMQVLRTLRQRDLETCVLILSARSEIADKVEGLDAGANDYLSSGGAGGTGPQPDPAAVHPAGCVPVLRQAVLQQPEPGRLCGGAAPCPDPEGDRSAGIPAAPSGTPGKSGRADGARLGRQCGPV